MFAPIHDKLLELESLQRELHATYRAIRYGRYPRENHASVVAAIEREGELRQSVRAWLEWHEGKRKRSLQATGTEG